MIEQYLSIGQLAKRTGSKVQTIRYYEQIGLMPETIRTDGNQRRFGRRHVERLAFIRHSRELGFPLDAIRELLALADDPNRSCAAADRIAKHQLQQVESRIDRLQALKSELKRMIAQCRGGRIADCRIIEVLGDHTKCLTQHQVESIEARPGIEHLPAQKKARRFR
jgi:Cu(I)-responsive transcriptional regulator